MPPLLARFRQSVPDQLPATGIAFRDVHSPNLPLPTLTPTFPHHKAERSGSDQLFLSFNPKTSPLGHIRRRGAGSPIGIHVSTDPCQPVLNPVCLLQGQRAEQSPHLSARHASRSRSAPRGRHLSSFLLSPTPANGQASRPHKRCLPRVRFRPVPSTHG